MQKTGQSTSAASFGPCASPFQLCPNNDFNSRLDPKDNPAQHKPRGCPLVTNELYAGGLRDLPAPIRVGVAHIFIQHLSASLCIAEDADPDVLVDMRSFLEKLVPDASACGVRLRHIAEGPGDMPSHVKSVLTSTNLTIPVSDGRLALGTWQGTCLAGARRWQA